MGTYGCLQAIKSDNCPLECWGKKTNFPILLQAAQSVLAVPATSCSSERVNSICGNVINYSRHSLFNHNALDAKK